MTDIGYGQGSQANDGNLLTPIRDAAEYVLWIRNEFKPLTLATPEATIYQQIENAIRYWNTHSGYKICQMVDYNQGLKRVQLDPSFKSVVQVYPNAKSTFIWNDHPLWTMLGVQVLDNVTTDLILMSEAFRNYQVYVGTNFMWHFDKAENFTEGGYLYAIHVPSQTNSLAVVGTKRILRNETITSDWIIDWLLRYTKALVSIVEGNTLRVASVIGLNNPGQQLLDAGKEDLKNLQDELAKNGRWVAFASRH